MKTLQHILTYLYFRARQLTSLFGQWHIPFPAMHHSCYMILDLEICPYKQRNQNIRQLSRTCFSQTDLGPLAYLGNGGKS